MVTKNHKLAIVKSRYRHEEYIGKFIVVIVDNYLIINFQFSYRRLMSSLRSSFYLNSMNLSVFTKAMIINFFITENRCYHVNCV